MAKRSSRERNEIDVFYAQEIYPYRNTHLGTSDPDKLSWEQQVALGRKRFSNLEPPFNYGDINAAAMRRKLRSTKPNPLNMV